MVRKTVNALFATASAAILVLGAYSYVHGVPDNALWISSATDRPRLLSALVHGTLHIVYTVPLDQPRVVEAKASLAGFSVKETMVGQTLARGVGLPFWFVCLLLSVYPAGSLVRGPLLRRRRRSKGRCTGCGYDLTGNVSGVCPECGSLVPAGPPGAPDTLRPVSRRLHSPTCRNRRGR